jgi:hypothetical protein
MVHPDKRRAVHLVSVDQVGDIDALPANLVQGRRVANIDGLDLVDWFKLTRRCSLNAVPKFCASHASGVRVPKPALGCERCKEGFSGGVHVPSGFRGR